jgi:hypothetical protein
MICHQWDAVVSGITIAASLLLTATLSVEPTFDIAAMLRQPYTARLVHQSRAIVEDLTVVSGHIDQSVY